MADKVKTIRLYNEVEIPMIGFGTFKIDNASAEDAVTAALRVGYRHIDTASMYRNEEAVGKAVKASGIAREDIFITSKVWNNDQGFHSTLEAFKKSCELLDTDYLDLYLIHWPKDKNLETWRALEKLYADGKVRSIGVSNFKIHHLQQLIDKGEMVPMVNQVELHPQFPQNRLRGYCEKFDIVIESWGPLMQGKAFSIPLLQEIAEEHGKTIAQVVLRWHYQEGLVSLPKTVHPDRMKSNLDIFEFELSKDDIERIATLKGGRIGYDPDTIPF